MILHLLLLCIYLDGELKYPVNASSSSGVRVNTENQYLYTSSLQEQNKGYCKCDPLKGLLVDTPRLCGKKSFSNQKSFFVRIILDTDGNYCFLGFS